MDGGHVTLIFYRGRAITYWDGRMIVEPVAQSSDGSFVIGAPGRDGFRVRLRPDFQGHGQRMDLTLEGSSRARTEGVPGTVFDVALFTTAPFEQRSRW